MKNRIKEIKSTLVDLEDVFTTEKGLTKERIAEEILNARFELKQLNRRLLIAVPP
jgi:hypothetical protein